MDPQRALRGVESVQTWGHGQWRVRQIPGDAAVKTYRCPGCDHEIRPGEGHEVVVPRRDPSERRHWHTGCWHRASKQRR